MIWSILLIHNLEYVRATIIRPWTVVIIVFLILVVYLVNWTSSKVDKFLKGGNEDE